MSGSPRDQVVWIEFQPVWNPTVDAEPVPEVVDIEPPVATPARKGLAVRTLGLLQMALGGLGVLVGIGLLLLGLFLADDIANGVDGGLVVTADVLEASFQTIDLAEGALLTAADGIDAVKVALGDFREGLGDVESITGGMSDLIGGELADTMESLRDSMPGLIHSGDAIDRALRASRAFGVPYDPEQTMGDAFREMEVSLEDLPGDLRREGALLRSTGAELADSQQSLRRIAGNLIGLEREFTDAARLLDQYRSTVDNARGVIAQARRDVATWRTIAPWVLLALGLFVILWQLFPISNGYRLFHRLPAAADG